MNWSEQFPYVKDKSFDHKNNRIDNTKTKFYTIKELNPNNKTKDIKKLKNSDYE